jgi:outer membrane receptor protein involved in Fe transport
MNVICTDPGSPRFTQLDPVAKKIQDLIPLPVGPTKNDIINSWLYPWESPNIRTIPSVKADYNLSRSSKLSFYWSMTTTWNPYFVAWADGLPSDVTNTRNTDVTAHTFRISFDHTLTPTMVVHLGVGMQTLDFTDATNNRNFNQLEKLGLPGANATIFPYITGLQAARGGMKVMGPFSQANEHMYKPTANASFTWVRSNHTYKFGADLRLERYPTAMIFPAYGAYNFAGDQTGLAIAGMNLSGGTIGFPYASFLLGLVNDGNTGVISNPRLGKSAWALFAQDSWKVTHKLTLDYGLRWDYQSYLRDTYGRVSNFSPATPNPTAGGLPGAVIFEGSGPGHCNCDFAKVYPYAFGPRLGAAYQINPKTVLRVGGGYYLRADCQREPDIVERRLPKPVLHGVFRRSGNTLAQRPAHSESVA